MIDFYVSLKSFFYFLNPEDLLSLSLNEEGYFSNLEINCLFFCPSFLQVNLEHKQLWFQFDPLVIVDHKFDVLRKCLTPEKDLNPFVSNRYDYQIDLIKTYFTIRSSFNLKPIFERDKKSFDSLRSLEKKYIGYL